MKNLLTLTSVVISSIILILSSWAEVSHSLAVGISKAQYKPASLTSQIIATNLLKDKIDSDSNHVFSPLGISSMLAILVEGARGDTYKELMSAFGFPEDQMKLRTAFKYILGSLYKEKLEDANRSFRTWFYIYRNNTAKDEYKKILEDYYFVHVKDIEMHYGGEELARDSVTAEDSPLATTTLSSNLPTTPINSKDIDKFEDLKIKSESVGVGKANDDNDAIADAVVPVKDKYNEQKDASKFDKVVEDKQYVEVPIIKEEISKENIMMNEGEKGEKDEQEIMIMMENKNDEERKPNARDTVAIEQEASGLNVEDNETVKDEEKLETLHKTLSPAAVAAVPVSPLNAEENVKPLQTEDLKKSNEPEKITIPLNKLDDPEVVQTLESHLVKEREQSNEARGLFRRNDVASALSANSIISRNDPMKTKMLLFNGLYYRGNWAYPFQELRSEVDDIFYVNSEKSVPVTMMRTRGYYRIADLDELKARVIELPYEDTRYAFYAVVPNEKDGLKDLIRSLKPGFCDALKDKLQKHFISLCLPKFFVEETSRSEETMKRLGVKKLFTPEAELTGISDQMDLHVEGLVQHVNVKIDEGAMRENALTAAAQYRSKAIAEAPVKSDDVKVNENVAESAPIATVNAPIAASDSRPEQQREIQEAEGQEDIKISVDRPFIYFVADRESDFILIAGKIMEPKSEDNLLSINN